MMLKYKDPNTKEFKKVYISSLDSLPAGTIIEYDGDTVPEGYEEVEDINFSTSSGVILYEDAEGSNLAITLNDNISNYVFLEIYYSSHNKTSHTSTKIDTSSSIVSLFTIESWGGALEVSATRYALSENTITTAGTCGLVSFLSDGTHKYTTSENNIYIYKVLGYK